MIEIGSWNSYGYFWSVLQFPPTWVDRKAGEIIAGRVILKYKEADLLIFPIYLLIHLRTKQEVTSSLKQVHFLVTYCIWKYPCSFLGMMGISASLFLSPPPQPPVSPTKQILQKFCKSPCCLL